MGAAGEEGAGSPVAASKGGGKGSGKIATATTASSSPPAASGTAALTTPAAAAATVVADGQPAAPPGSYSEWAAAFQAYYAAGGGQPPPPGGFAPHPYMWGGQPIMPPPYGAPPPYGGMFPPAAGMYGHPGMYGQYGAPPPPLPAPPVASEVAKEHAEHPKQESVEGGAKSQTSKQSTLKRTKGSKGSSLMTTTTLKRKGSDGGKENGAGGFAPSSNGDENESGSDASTDASEDESPQNLTHNKRSFDQLALNASGVGGGGGGGGGGSYVPPPPPAGQSHPDTTPALGTPGTGAGSLEMSLDYWNTGSASLVKASKQMSASPSTSAPPTELWLQDERELKRQRRKQSNRESARRSRLRKQAECEELGTRVDSLNVENVALRTELSRMTEECKRLQAENAALHGQLCNIPQQVTVRASESEDVPVANDEEDEDSQPKENGNSKRKQDNPAGLRPDSEQVAPS